MVNYHDIVKATRKRMKKEKISMPKLVKVLNGYIQEEDKIPSGRTGVVQLSRWLNPESKYHCVPRANITLAMLQWSYSITLVPAE